MSVRNLQTGVGQSAFHYSGLHTLGLTPSVGGAFANQTTYEIKIVKLAGDILFYYFPAFTLTNTAPTQIVGINLLPSQFRPTDDIRQPAVFEGDLFVEYWVRADGSVRITNFTADAVDGGPLNTFDNLLPNATHTSTGVTVVGQIV